MIDILLEIKYLHAAGVIDGHANPHSISEMFTGKHCDLCSSVGYNEANMSEIRATIEDRVA